jgi:hypothetical protein
MEGCLPDQPQTGKIRLCPNRAQTEFVDQLARLFDVGKEVPPALGREPFALMQGPTVAKLAMKASCRHYLHEPRRRPQSTFIVVRHLHFPGNRGFGARNELCSHIDYSPLFSRV